MQLITNVKTVDNKPNEQFVAISSAPHFHK